MTTEQLAILQYIEKRGGKCDSDDIVALRLYKVKRKLFKQAIKDRADQDIRELMGAKCISNMVGGHSTMRNSVIYLENRGREAIAFAAEKAEEYDRTIKAERRSKWSFWISVIALLISILSYCSEHTPA